MIQNHKITEIFMEADNEVLFRITKEDLREEALHYLGREMNEEEYTKAKKLLEFGAGENLRYIYYGVFLEIMDKSNNG
ncbi:MAG TPA: hypothetical protein PKI67_03705 [bacterium]|nr:hypothetical protein [bacterium]HNO10011.1 hypothetical protein [bacterium]